MLKIYLAGALFSVAEREYNEKISAILEELGYEVFLPQNSSNTDDDAILFSELVNKINESDIVLAVCDGTQTDDGTAWELGYAFAKDIPTVLLRTDFRQRCDSDHYNLMLKFSASDIINVSDLDNIKETLDDVLKRVEYVYLSGK